MNAIVLKTNIEEYNYNELSNNEQHLLTIADQHAQHAYAPYSCFRVGVAILLANGEIVGGSNQENASYPAGICAERTALSACASLYPNVAITALAIIVNSLSYKANSITAPCGICRQSIKETESRYNHAIDIIFPSKNGLFIKCKSIENLLPLSFDGTNLNNKV